MAGDCKLAPLQRPCAFLGARHWIGTPGFSSRLQIGERKRRCRRLSTSVVSMYRKDRRQEEQIFDAIPDNTYESTIEIPRGPNKNPRKKPYLKSRAETNWELRRLIHMKNMGFSRSDYDPPHNGLLVEHLIPVAYTTMEQLEILQQGLEKLTKVVGVHACSVCKEIHIGARGHTLRNCRGYMQAQRRGLHAWGKGYPQDVFIPVETFHVVDRLGPRIRNESKFSHPRICAITELCIQAGYDHPDYPIIRWANSSGEQYGMSTSKEPHSKLLQPYTGIIGDYLGKNPKAEAKALQFLLDARNGFAEGGHPEYSTEQMQIELNAEEKQDIVATAQRTVRAFQAVRRGVTILKRSYKVLTCGYCPEVHVGPRGHGVRLCTGFKKHHRQWQHFWQEATLEDIMPLNMVWHAPEDYLVSSLLNYCGKAPAVVELCVQAGAQAPAEWRPLMKIGVVAPDVNSREFAV